ncbi:MAG: hypothetical protein GXO69_02945 [Acidobacteria bacterium]|nr:hypothetical protein [Acidobacteriota bacterium]
MKKTKFVYLIFSGVILSLMLSLSCSSSSAPSSQPSNPGPQPVVVQTWYQSVWDLAGDDTEMIPVPNIIETADCYLISMAFHGPSSTQDSVHSSLFRLGKLGGLVKPFRIAIADSLLVDMVYEDNRKLLMVGQTISNTVTEGVSVQTDKQGTVSDSYHWPNIDELVRVCLLNDKAVFAGYKDINAGRLWVLLGVNGGSELWRTEFSDGRVFDSKSRKSETVKLVRIADVVEDPGNGIAILVQLEKQGTGNPISGFAIALINADEGTLNWSKAWYANSDNVNWYPLQLLIHKDGTFLVSYGSYSFINDIDVWDSFVLNIDRNGDTIWSDEQYGVFFEPARNMALLADGSVLIAIATGSDYEDNGNGSELLVNNLDIRKLDRNGNMMWMQYYETGPLRQLFAIVSTSDGGMIVAASTSEANDLTNESCVKGFDVYKLDANGKCPGCN